MISFQQSTAEETQTMSTEFEYFYESIDIVKVEKVLSMPLTEEEKRLVLGYVLVRPLEGVRIKFPKKGHTTAFAKMLLEMGADLEEISRSLEITTKTLKKLGE